MLTKEELIGENALLRARLALAEKWMRREVQSAIMSVARAQVTRDTRKHFENTFEQEGLEMITERVMDMFHESLAHTPKYTLERLIDAEIYWETLQRYPHMDALPIVIAYQKILDAWIEYRLIAPWRQMLGKIGKIPSMGASSTSLERDLENILKKDYTLSVGRWYQILTLIQAHQDTPPIVESLVTFWSSTESSKLALMTSTDFISILRDLMEREIFSKKRHEKKVSYTDAKATRMILLGSSESPGILKQLFL